MDDSIIIPAQPGWSVTLDAAEVFPVVAWRFDEGARGEPLVATLHVHTRDAAAGVPAVASAWYLARVLGVEDERYEVVPPEDAL